MTEKLILAPVGDFPQDDAVLARALELRAASGARLIAVHFVDLPAGPGDIASVGSQMGQAALAARDKIGAALGRLRADPGQVEMRVEAGSPSLGLIDICDALRPGLVVMRAHQKVSIADKLLGSTTDRLIASGCHPVLVVKREAADAYGKVIVATNGHDDVERSLRCARNLLPSASLTLAEAVQIPPPLEGAMLRSGTDQAELASYRQALARDAQQRLRDIAAAFAPDVKTKVLRGAPATALARAARLVKADLIVVGPGRNGLIRRAFIGSVTRRLLRDAPCDVLVCPPAAPCP
ncbi:universal stress protein [Roseovarius nanhaiticus]|uniref:universal stress protein n=1 Tax=Roseovarius nanhaiticus TaxID=573024 RepID=UPI0024914F37|nr:universal stress protein [Roseovarius nanhaiticus]